MALCSARLAPKRTQGLLSFTACIPEQKFVPLGLPSGLAVVHSNNNGYSEVADAGSPGQLRLPDRGGRPRRLSVGQSVVGEPGGACVAAGGRRARQLPLDSYPGRLPLLHRQPAYRLVL